LRPLEAFGGPILVIIRHPAKVLNFKSKRNFILKMKKPKNLGFEPVHPKNVLLASVVHGISCLFWFLTIYRAAEIVQNDYGRGSLGQISKSRFSAFFIITMKFLIHRA
jgi:hypothetical protein